MPQSTDKRQNQRSSASSISIAWGRRHALDIVASDSERAALAKRFGFLGLPAFSAR
jgi:hypothetical protein